MNIHLEQPVVTAGPPLEESTAVVLLYHGRGQTTGYVLELAERINVPDVHYVAPQAAENSWYPAGFMEERSKNEPYLQYALDSYHERVTELLAKGVAKERLILLGFSQGACLTAEYAYRNPDRYGGIILYTGGLIGPPETQWNKEGSFGGTPVFLGSSDNDSWVPESRVHTTDDVFKRMDAEITKRIYKGMGHEVNDDEIVFARKLIQKVQQSHSN